MAAKLANMKGGNVGKMLSIHRGTTRVVVVCGSVAVKFPRGERGKRCNKDEGQVWEQNRSHPARGRWLCPVLWHDPNGHVLIMRAAAPLPAGAQPIDQLACDWRDYQGGGDTQCPCEHKPEDWGILDGLMVCVDYSEPAL